MTEAREKKDRLQYVQNKSVTKYDALDRFDAQKSS